MKDYLIYFAANWLNVIAGMLFALGFIILPKSLEEGVAYIILSIIMVSISYYYKFRYKQ